MTRTCEGCGGPVPRLNKRFCGNACRLEFFAAQSRSQVGAANPRFTGGLSECDGYIICVHRSATGWTFMHRAVMAAHLGRPSLGPDEIVHHIDGNRRNNDIANLELTTRAGHIAIHRNDLHIGRGIARAREAA